MIRKRRRKVFQSIFEYFGDEETTENHVVSFLPRLEFGQNKNLYIYRDIKKISPFRNL